MLPFFPQEPALAALAALPELQVVQTQIAGIDRIRPWVPAMKDGALFVNGARGVLVDQRALEAELTAGRLSAALDVTDPEPLGADSPLWARPKRVSLPRISPARLRLRYGHH